MTSIVPFELIDVPGAVVHPAGDQQPEEVKLTDRGGARPVVLTGIAVTTLGAFTYTQVTSHTPELVLAASLLVWRIGIAAVAVPISAAAFADTFWWVLGFTALAAIPALFLPTTPAGNAKGRG